MAKICIDPGHGGSDPGAVGRVLGLLEKNINLAVALRLRDVLANTLGQEVVLTREDDRDVDLMRRVQIANQSGSHLFVSIHCNAADAVEAQGTETFHYHPAESEQLARAVQAELVAALGRPDRGVKTAGFYVIRKTDIPSILAESAFISNEEEEALLATEEGVIAVAQGIAQGLATHLGLTWPEMEQLQGQDAKPEIPPVTQPENPPETIFTDVKGHPLEPFILEAVKLGLMKGTGDRFEPDRPITRGEMAVLIIRLNQLFSQN